ncbi:General transcription factor 3C polypeptide 6 [Chamberlinius hualienensis]
MATLSEADEQLSSTSDSEYEECVLLLEFTGIIDDEFLSHCRSATQPCQILALDSDAPILQLGDYSFEGKYEFTNGTAVLFERPSTSLEDSLESKTDLSDDMDLEYFAITNNKLTLTRIFMTEKKDNNAMPTDST